MKIKQEIKVLPGAPIEGLNPLPAFRSRKPNLYNTSADFPDELKVGLGCYTKVLPYLVQDRYSRKRIPLRIKNMVLENKYLRCEFFPEFGGRLYALYDKVNGVDLVLKNEVIQPCNLAIRNAWLSGGIEWNVGSFGHTATTCDNVFCAKLTDGFGNDFLRIYEYERIKSIFWQVDFHLPDDSPYLQVHVKMINPNPRATTTYWWSNTAVPENGKTRVLASEENIISFVDSEMRYEKLPHISAMPGADVSYPSNATRAFDFFIQAKEKNASTWEAAAYENGVTMYERSTAPLTCKKMFCWGNHHAGKHWQEFLSEKGKGYYAEIQAGIAPSQLHDRILGAYEVLEWTQCFGGVRADTAKLYDPDYGSACRYLGEIIDALISKEDITRLDAKLARLASTPVSEKDLIHLGSGFGAVEGLRLKKDGAGEIPKSMCFPEFTIGRYEYPWKYLIENGNFPPEDARYYTPSYNVNEHWLPYIEKAALSDTDNWYAHMQYGIAVYDGVDNTVFASDAYTDEDNERRTAIAEREWKRSIELSQSYLAYRNLARLEIQRNNNAAAIDYYQKAIGIQGAFDDYALAAEYSVFLTKIKEYQMLWDFYNSLPENCRNADRIKIQTAIAAVKLDKIDYLEVFFAEEHYDIREGENSLTDIWFEFCARKMAKERGISKLDDEILDKLIDEAWEKCPPDESIDFRMSFSRSTKYRVNQ